MERPTKAIPAAVPPPPARSRAKKKPRSNVVLAQQKAFLREYPEMRVVDNSYPRETEAQALKSVKAAMYQVNSGGRAEWPSDQYYAIWQWAPQELSEDESDEAKPRVPQLLIGNRSHIEEVGETWMKLINGAGSRKNSKGSSEVSDDPFDTEGFKTEDD